VSEEKKTLIVGIVTVLIGIYCILAAGFNWNWFFKNSRASGVTSFFQRNGARIFYALLGLLFAGLGIYVLAAR
jgi:hypothetical protein